MVEVGAPDERLSRGRTQPASEFALGSPASAPGAVPPAAGEAPDLRGGSVLERLLAHGRRVDPGEPSQRYAVERLLGVGANGRVFAVSDADLDRSEAMKVLAEAAADAEDARRFIEEARITASLAHLNVLPVYELDLTADGRVFFTMKRIDGGSLASLIESGAALAVAEVARIFIGIAQAIAYAHHRGVVHQDIKPDNVMLGAFGEVLVVDWGSAIRLGGEPRIYGTPLYMSPEQARGRERRPPQRCLLPRRQPVPRPARPAADLGRHFWRRKREGLVDAPSAASRRRCWRSRSRRWRRGRSGGTPRPTSSCATW